MARTPPFLRWALTHACPFRDPAREPDLEQIGRQLLVLRACGDAFAEDRVFEEIAFARDIAGRSKGPSTDVNDSRNGDSRCDSNGDLSGDAQGDSNGDANGDAKDSVREHGRGAAEHASSTDARSTGMPQPISSPRGFRVAEVFAAYGGRERIESLCPGCPVNVGRASWAPSVPTWAGCCGMVEWSAWGEPAAWDALIDRLLAELDPRDTWRSLFLPTRPTWPGLWAAGPLTAARLELLEPLLALLESFTPLEAAFRDFAAAARFARRTGNELRVRLYPGGDVQGRRWLVDAHCSRCSSTRADNSRVCSICGWDASAIPARRRGAYGGRPYWPLEQMLGPEPAAALAARYRQRRVH